MSDFGNFFNGPSRPPAVNPFPSSSYGAPPGPRAPAPAYYDDPYRCAPAPAPYPSAHAPAYNGAPAYEPSYNDYRPPAPAAYPPVDPYGRPSHPQQPAYPPAPGAYDAPPRYELERERYEQSWRRDAGFAPPPPAREASTKQFFGQHVTSRGFHKSPPRDRRTFPDRHEARDRWPERERLEFKRERSPFDRRRGDYRDERRRDDRGPRRDMRRYSISPVRRKEPQKEKATEKKAKDDKKKEKEDTKTEESRGRDSARENGKERDRGDSSHRDASSRVRESSPETKTAREPSPAKSVHLVEDSDEKSKSDPEKPVPTPVPEEVKLEEVDEYLSLETPMSPEKEVVPDTILPAVDTSRRRERKENVRPEDDRKSRKPTTVEKKGDRVEDKKREERSRNEEKKKEEERKREEDRRIREEESRRKDREREEEVRRRDRQWVEEERRNDQEEEQRRSSYDRKEAPVLREDSWRNDEPEHKKNSDGFVILKDATFEEVHRPGARPYGSKVLQKEHHPPTGKQLKPYEEPSWAEQYKVSIMMKKNALHGIGGPPQPTAPPVPVQAPRPYAPAPAYVGAIPAAPYPAPERPAPYPAPERPAPYPAPERPAPYPAPERYPPTAQDPYAYAPRADPAYDQRSVAAIAAAKFAELQATIARYERAEAAGYGRPPREEIERRRSMSPPERRSSPYHSEHYRSRPEPEQRRRSPEYRSDRSRGQLDERLSRRSPQYHSDRSRSDSERGERERRPKMDVMDPSQFVEPLEDDAGTDWDDVERMLSNEVIVEKKAKAPLINAAPQSVHELNSIIAAQRHALAQQVAAERERAAAAAERAAAAVERERAAAAAFAAPVKKPIVAALPVRAPPLADTGHTFFSLTQPLPSTRNKIAYEDSVPYFKKRMHEDAMVDGQPPHKTGLLDGSGHRSAAAGYPPAPSAHSTPYPGQTIGEWPPGYRDAPRHPAAPSNGAAAYYNSAAPAAVAPLPSSRPDAYDPYREAAAPAYEDPKYRGAVSYDRLASSSGAAPYRGGPAPGWNDTYARRY